VILVTLPITSQRHHRWDRGQCGSQLKLAATVELSARRPRLFADLIREIKNMPDAAVLRPVREVRDGKW